MTVRVYSYPYGYRCTFSCPLDCPRSLYENFDLCFASHAQTSQLQRDINVNMLPRRIQRVIRLVSRSSGSCRNQYSVPCRDFSALPQSDGEWVSAVASSPTTAKEAESDEYRGVNPSNDFSERKGDHCRKISVTRKLGKDLLNVRTDSLSCSCVVCSQP